MPSPLKNILIGVDASDCSLEAVRYVGNVMPTRGTGIRLFHVLNPLPESFYDLEALPSPGHEGFGVHSWKAQQRKNMEVFMERARQEVLILGYPPESISAWIRQRELGVARDIAREAAQGYDALVIGRKGMSPLKDLILGSIANKLVSHLTHPPVWVVGGHPQPDKILIAMDSSKGARKAFDYVTSFFGKVHPELLLLHVSRGHDLLRDWSEGNSLQENWLQKVKQEFKSAEQTMQSIFNDCLTSLEREGADTSRIKTRIIPGVYSRAAAIYGEAKEGGYGTIVVGRRGLSRVDEFFMGRVSNKLLQLSEEKAVWIVQ